MLILQHRGIAIKYIYTPTNYLPRDTHLSHYDQIVFLLARKPEGKHNIDRFIIKATLSPHKQEKNISGVYCSSTVYRKIQDGLHFKYLL